MKNIWQRLVFIVLEVVTVFYALLIYLENQMNGIDASSISGFNAVPGSLGFFIVPFFLLMCLVASGKGTKWTSATAITTSVLFVGQIVWYFAT